MRIKNKMTKTETINYMHKSNSEKITVIPKTFGDEASKLVKFALETEDTLKLITKVQEFPYLLNTGVLKDMADLYKMKDNLQSPEALKLQDKVYIEICKLRTQAIKPANNYHKYGLDTMIGYLNKEIKDLEDNGGKK
jgi:hypothetical protein